MTKILPLICFLGMTVGISAQTSFPLLVPGTADSDHQLNNIEVSGPVSGQWTADTVLVTGDLEIMPGENLTISPGTVVLFSGSFRISVKGSVTANGEANDPVLFTVADTTGFSDTLSNAGGWQGFVYEHLASGADSSLFSHCVFEYGKAFGADTFNQYGGVFRVFDFNKITFFSCTFTLNRALRWGGAVFAKNSDLIFDHCTFTGNRCGLSVQPWGYGGGICSLHADPVVTNCLFEGNIATGIGGGASFDDSDPEIHHNLFSDNYGGLGGGFGILRSTPSRVVSNNLVTLNEALFYGGGIACIRTNTVFTNNSIVNNLSMSGGGFYCNDSAAPALYNTILRSNEGLGHEVYIWDVRSAPSFYYCNVEDGIAAFEGSGAHEGYLGTFENNQDTTVMFRGTGDFPFALQAGSPCIDAGTPDTLGLLIPATDLEGRNRIFNGRIDIGAYEWNPGEGITAFGAKAPEINAWPNPATDEVTLVINTGVATTGDLRIISTHGIVVHEEAGIRLFPGNNRFTWDLTDDSGRLVTPGLYFCLIAGASCSLIVL